MHAIAAFDPLPVDDPASLRDVEVPEPEPGPLDVLIRVEAVSVNPVDVKKRAGGYGRGAVGDEPRVLGYDGAGTVVAVGDEVEGLDEGDEVWWAGDAGRQGANADLQAVDHRIVARKPESVSFADAAAMPLAALTAWEGMFDHLRINREDSGTMLVVGGAGGVGSLLTQLAKRLTALRIIATAGREESEAWCLRMGADAVADRHDLVASVEKLAPAGVDSIFSAYTPGNVGTFARLIRPFGAVVSIDGTDESLLPLFAKSASMHWEYMFARSRYDTWDIGEQARILDEVAGLVDRGDIVSTATERIADFSAAGLREAHRLVESQSVIGKVVVHR
ncbi:zinc-binding alcohol dehydrogenase family protein [Demequina sp. NBRC 110053]|uniref:zinc-binding alcohol dehydrogenase family protein n=1 Tax=Demequina sp. NBRC 110053 TaxID=1570342 RepID=UPI0009FCCDCF|nr:zinc-binding alcohol dehydrogenase family protein [Demequina sp. NBRC 110053]